MRVSRELRSESVFDGPALEDVNKGESQAGGINDKQSGIVCVAEDLLALSEGEVEDEDGGLDGHQGGILAKRAEMSGKSRPLHREKKTHI